jgi:hypothetical protein
LERCYPLEGSRERYIQVNDADFRYLQDKKDKMHKDIYGFFAAKKVYKDLAIPWKVCVSAVILTVSSATHSVA